MSILNQVRTQPKHRRPLRLLIHGEPKTGKSHLASGIPNAVHLDLEGGAGSFEGVLELDSWESIKRAMGELSNADHPYKTVIIDTLDALERYIGASVCLAATGNHKDPSSIPFGKGWAQVEAELYAFTEQIASMQKRRGLNVVVLAHSTPTTHSEPDGTSWKQWRLRCHKKTHDLIAGWVEDIGFYRVVTSTDKGIGKSRQRVVEFRAAAQWEAGSRRIKQASVRIPDAEPDACWGAIRKAYQAGMPAPAKRQEPKRQEAPAQSANEPAQSEPPASREPSAEDVAGKDDNGVFVRRREHRREWWERYLAAEAKDAGHELTTEEMHSELLKLLAEDRQTELGELPYEQLWKGDPPDEAIDHKDLTRLKEWLSANAADYEPEWTA